MMLLPRRFKINFFGRGKGEVFGFGVLVNCCRNLNKEWLPFAGMGFIAVALARARYISRLEFLVGRGV